MVNHIILLLFITLIQLISCSIPMSATPIRKPEEAGMAMHKNKRFIKQHVVLRSGDNAAAKMTKSNTIFEINSDYDLKGTEVRIGSNSVIRFNGGCIKNGTLKGANTELDGQLTGIFENIHFSGSWSIPLISTDMWKSLDYPNSLQDVFSLLNADLENKIVINRSNYNYRLVAGPQEGILNILDNTDILINGNIVLLPNGFNGYELIRITSCSNVKIHGNGTISGDRPQHDYTSVQGTHEFGHGFVIRASRNIDISGITMRDFTGDALCLMDNCSKIKIHDVTVKDCRRCAVSIRADHDIVIDNCLFSGIVNDKYNQPSAAVDIEPVVDCKVYNIDIKNCHFSNNARGISSNARNYYGGSYKKGNKTVREGRRYVNLKISNCSFKNSTYTSFIAPFGWESVSIKDCTFYNGRQDDIRIGYTKKCVIKNCSTSCDIKSRPSLNRNFITTYYDNKNIQVEGCTGNRVKRVFNKDENCKLINSDIKINSRLFF